MSVKDELTRNDLGTQPNDKTGEIWSQTRLNHQLSHIGKFIALPGNRPKHALWCKKWLSQKYDQIYRNDFFGQARKTGQILPKTFLQLKMGHIC